MHHMFKLYILAKLLTIIGALNWGLVGLLNFDLVAAIFGKKSIASKIIYILVGLSGLFLLKIYKMKYIAIKHRGLTRAKKYSGQEGHG